LEQGENMRILFHALTVILAFSAASVAAQDATQPEEAPNKAEEGQAIDSVIQPAGMHVLEEYLWLKRPLVILADSPNDPRFTQQMDLLNERLEDLAERDVVVLTDTDPSTLSPLREKLRPRGFMLVLLGKDGNVYLRKPFPWSVREITRSIDKLPLRQQEVRDRRE
jgi:hypothetical protein